LKSTDAQTGQIADAPFNTCAPDNACEKPRLRIVRNLPDLYLELLLNGSLITCAYRGNVLRTATVLVT